MIGRALLELSRSLHAVKDLQEVMGCVRDACRAATRYDRVYVQLPSADGRSYSVVGYVLPDRERVLELVARVELDKDPFMRKVLALEEPCVFADVRLEPLADQAHVEAFGLRTAIVIPMFDGQEGMGPLNIATFADQGVMLPTEQELDFFTQVASLVAMVIARLRAEEARIALEKRMISTQKLEALGRLAGEVAHDFNNLLLTILGNVDLAGEDLGEHRAQAYLHEVRNATLRAAGLSRQLLAFSRGQVLRNLVFELNPLVQRSVQLLERLIPASIDVRVMLGPQTGSVKGDAGQLEQVLMNLVLNARDALPKGGSIAIETQNVRVDETFIADRGNIAPGRYILLTVTDDGEGMDEATQQRIFEPFFTTKAEEHGTGLGLSVVQGIVSQHNGHVHVYSEIGVGTTFKVYLPLSEQPASAVGSRLPTKHSRLKGSERVLVVDDDEQVRDTVVRVLTRQGYAATAAKGGRQALDEQTPPALLLTDVVMADVGGFELAEKLSERWPEMKVLLMTGYAPSRQIEVRWASITKPFTPTELMVRVRDLLDGSEAAD